MRNPNDVLDVFKDYNLIYRGQGIWNMHWHVMAVLKALNIKMTEGGMCHGIAVTGLFAFLRGPKTMKMFGEDYCSLSHFTDDKDTLQRKLNILRNHAQNRSLTKEDKDLLNAVTLAQNISVNHNLGFMYKELLPTGAKRLNQSSNLSSADAILSPNLPHSETKNELLPLGKYWGSYSQDDLLNNLDEIIKMYPEPSEDTHGPLGFLISSHNHTISYGYDPALKVWFMLNANDVPIYQPMSKEEICHLIWSGISENGSERCWLENEVFSLSGNVDYLPENILDWIDKKNNMDLRKIQNLNLQEKVNLLKHSVSSGYHELTQAVLSCLDNRGMKDEITLRQKLMMKTVDEKTKKKGNRLIEDILISAVQHGELRNVDLLMNIENPISADLMSKCLHEAIYCGHLELLKVLIQKAGKMKLELNDLFSLAAKEGYLDIAKFLIEFSKEPLDLYAALKEATFHGQIESMRYLIDQGALTDIGPDADYELHLAAIQGGSETSYSLISQILPLNDKHKTDLEKIRNLIIAALNQGWGNWAATFAFSVDQRDLRTLLKNVDINPYLIKAIRQGQKEVIYFINELYELYALTDTESDINNEAFSVSSSVNEYRRTSFTPLDWAIYAGQSDIFESLLTKSKKIPNGEDRQKLFDFARELENTDAMKVLIKWEVDRWQDKENSHKEYSHEVIITTVTKDFMSAIAKSESLAKDLIPLIKPELWPEIFKKIVSLDQSDARKKIEFFLGNGVSLSDLPKESQEAEPLKSIINDEKIKKVFEDFSNNPALKKLSEDNLRKHFKEILGAIDAKLLKISPIFNPLYIAIQKRVDNAIIEDLLEAGFIINANLPKPNNYYYYNNKIREFEMHKKNIQTIKNVFIPYLKYFPEGDLVRKEAETILNNHYRDYNELIRLLDDLTQDTIENRRSAIISNFELAFKTLAKEYKIFKPNTSIEEMLSPNILDMLRPKEKTPQETPSNSIVTVEPELGQQIQNKNNNVFKDFNKKFRGNDSGKWHDHVIDLLPAMHIKNKQFGLCFGISTTGMYAFLQGMKSFEAFGSAVCAVSNISSSEDELQRNMNLLTEHANQHTLTAKDQELIDAIALAENISLHFFPSGEYREIYPKEMEHRGQTGSKLLTESILRPEVKTSEDGPKPTTPILLGDSFAIFNEETMSFHLKNYLNALVALSADKNQDNNSIGFTICCSPGGGLPGHAITFGYRPVDNTWFFLDANQEPIYPVMDINKLCSSIQKGMAMLLDKNHQNLYSFIKVFSTNKIDENLKSEIVELINMSNQALISQIQELSIKDKAGFLTSHVPHSNLSIFMELLNTLDIPDQTQEKHKTLRDFLLSENIEKINEWKNELALIYGKIGSNEITYIEYISAIVVYDGEPELLTALLSKNLPIDRESLNKGLELCTSSSRRTHLKILLETSKSVEGSPDFGKLLTVAASIENIAVFQDLLQYIHSNKLTVDYTDAVCKAASKGSIEILEELIKNKVPLVNPTLENSPLIAALEGGQWQVVEFLIKQGAGSQITQDNNAALLLAALRGGSKTLYELLTKEKNISFPISNRKAMQELFERALALGWVDVAESLIKQPNFKPTHLNIFFLKAVTQGQTEVVTFLVKQGAMLNYQGVDSLETEAKKSSATDPQFQAVTKGFTALHWAVYTGRTSMISHLLTLGADPAISISVHKVGTPLELAIRIGNVDAIKKLVDWNVEHNLSEMNVRAYIFLIDENYLQFKEFFNDSVLPNNLTLLLTAMKLNATAAIDYFISQSDDLKLILPQVISYATSATIKKLVDHGADLNAIDKEGKTALHLAIVQDKLDCMQTLLNLGADFTIQDHQGTTPLALLEDKAKNNPELRSLVQDLKIKLLFNELMHDTQMNKENILSTLHEKLVKIGYVIPNQTSQNFNPLLFALEKRADIKIIRLLLEVGCTLTPDEKMSCPLHVRISPQMKWVNAQLNSQTPVHSSNVFFGVGADLHHQFIGKQTDSEPVHESSKVNEQTPGNKNDRKMK